jgi:membrane-associated phospholipid phosphatase
MSAPVVSDPSPSYFAGLLAVLRRSAAQLVRPPSHARRAVAARRMARHGLLLCVIVGVVIVALMFGLDAAEIQLMPPRGTPGLWPVRVLTNFGKDAYVLGSLAGMLLAVAVISPWLQGSSRSQLLRFGTRLQFLFLAVLLPVLAGDVVKGVVGRGRPFVGGKANAFNFAPLTGTEAYASFPSGHAVAGFALAFAVAALWPRARVVMAVYAVLIACTRLALLAHHPSDVVGGALVGVIGAMGVRYWFAARHLAFTIRHDGEIVPVR